MEMAPIENLRIAFAQSIVATMVTQVSTYLRLVAHPEAQFADLLEALGRNAVIGDDAAQRLHRRLSLPVMPGPPMVQRGYWEQVLKERGIPLEALVRGELGAAPVPVPMPASAATASMAAPLPVSPPVVEETAEKTI